MSEEASRINRPPLRAGARYIAQRMALFLAFGAILFTAAGRLDWIRGWIYLVLGLFLEICTLIVLARRAPETLNQRGALHTGVKTFDKIFAVTWLALSLVTPVIAGLDERFGWSSMSAVMVYVGAILLVAGSTLGSWAMIENAHFEQFVRIQTDRGHQVVTSGPYRIVRHPGYAAAILGALVAPLMLGSWWAFVPAGAVALLFIIRTALEDWTLQQELEGYKAYAQQTRYRLVPGIW